MPAGQPLIYTLQTSLTITDTFAFIVQVFENGTEIGKYYLKPNSNDRAHFDLNRVIQARTRVDEKVYGASTLLFDYSALPYTRSNGNMNKYEVKIGEYTGTEALAQATKYIYVMDGYEQVTSGLHPSFADYYGTASTKKFWLTDREPVNNVITIEAADDDEGFMAFINKDTVSDVTRLSFLLVPPTGSPTTVTKDLNTTNDLVEANYHYPAERVWDSRRECTVYHSGLHRLQRPSGTGSVRELAGRVGLPQVRRASGA